LWESEEELKEEKFEGGHGVASSTSYFTVRTIFFNPMMKPPLFLPVLLAVHTFFVIDVLAWISTLVTLTV
jgi:hypothetical protein